MSEVTMFELTKIPDEEWDAARDIAAYERLDTTIGIIEKYYPELTHYTPHQNFSHKKRISIRGPYSDIPMVKWANIVACIGQTITIAGSEVILMDVGNGHPKGTLEITVWSPLTNGEQPVNLRNPEAVIQF